MRAVQFAATLLLGLLLLSGISLAMSVQTRIMGSIPSKVMLLAADTNAQNSSSINLNGIWQDQDDANITYRIQETCTAGSSCQVVATYVTDPECPSAIGTTFLTRTTLSGNPPFVGNDTMLSCTPADNPIVENCSQPAIWDTTFNATFTNNTITGQYIDQYWTWNTTSNGQITDCRIQYTFANTFTLTRAPPNSTSTFSTVLSSSTQKPSPGPPTSGGQGSGSSSTSKSANSSTMSNSTSTSSSRPGSVAIAWVYYVAAAAGLLAIVGVSLIFLRRKL